MKALFFTNEYPPYVYGGAGVHVEYLTRELAHLIQVEVRCFGDQTVTMSGLAARGFGADAAAYAGAPKSLQSLFTTLERCLKFTGTGIDARLVHCHTWYTHMAGVWAKLTYGIPLVITTHSLEPLRPWKREQLGGGYDFSCWVEKTAIEMADAVIAVSEETKNDVMKLFKVAPEKMHIIYNGIDTEEFRKVPSRAALGKYGILHDRPYVLFVGRITRQKGIMHLINALPHIDENAQIVLCAGAPDTPEFAAEMKEAVERVSAIRSNVIWIREMVDKETLIELYSHAAVFCCPSIYEPFGIINLEAMACEVPVVGSRVGGIPEVVVNGETGLLVPLEQFDSSPFEARYPDVYAKDLALGVNRLLKDPELARGMGRKGRVRAETVFSWKSIARKTKELYQSLLEGK